MPTIDEIIHVLSLTKEALEADTDDARVYKALFLWYYDKYLTAAAGKHWWRDDVKHYYLPTDTQDVAGVQKVNVTITSEAFGLLVYENCQQKWLRQLTYKQNYGKNAKFPKGKKDTDLDGKTADYYNAKWSDSNEGQVQFGGWAPAAYDRFEVLKQTVKNLRDEDAKKDKEMQKFALKLIKEDNQVEHATLEEKLASKKRSKRKRAAREPAPKKLTRMDE